jgi:RNA polymerase sigma-70 factor (ECF subfamily)
VPEKASLIVETTEICQLVRNAQAGNRAAFGELVRLFEGNVFAVALRRLRNRTEASELTQDVFIQAYRKLEQLREPERFAGWLKRITVRMAINRAVRRPPEIAQDPAILAQRDSARNSPLDGLLSGERAEQLRGGLARLRDLDRRTLVAFYFEGQSLLEMSDQFRSPVGTIKRRLHTARNRLREALDQLQPA